MRRAGPTLTILRKEADGRWRVARDANFVAAIELQAAQRHAGRAKRDPKVRTVSIDWIPGPPQSGVPE